jgi:hypothetical protein
MPQAAAAPTAPLAPQVQGVGQGPQEGKIAQGTQQNQNDPKAQQNQQGQKGQQAQGQKGQQAQSRGGVGAGQHGEGVQGGGSGNSKKEEYERQLADLAGQVLSTPDSGDQGAVNKKRQDKRTLSMLWKQVAQEKIQVDQGVQQQVIQALGDAEDTQKGSGEREHGRGHGADGNGMGLAGSFEGGGMAGVQGRDKEMQAQVIPQESPKEAVAVTTPAPEPVQKNDVAQAAPTLPDGGAGYGMTGGPGIMV